MTYNLEGNEFTVEIEFSMAGERNQDEVYYSDRIDGEAVVIVQRNRIVIYCGNIC